MSKERIDTTFHETFTLNTPALASVLQVCDENEGNVTLELLSEATNLGANYVKAMPRYARGCGLIEMGSHSLTTLGHTVLSKDKHILRPETLWLMHYHMSAPHGPGPTFWNDLVTNVMRIGQSIGRSTTSRAIGAHIVATTGKDLSVRTLESTATIFLGTYAKSDGLGKLGLLEATEESKGTYEVKQPELPGAWVLGYALADFWDNHSPHTSELLLRDLGSSNGLAGLFFMGAGMLSTLLSDLQTAGLVAIKRDAPPFVLTKLWRSREELLERVYG